MKTGLLLAVAFATLTSIPLMAQQADVNAQQSASANAAGTQATAGFGDEAASHAWEMSSVNGELQGKLDTKTAKVGDQVVLKTTQKVLTPDGTEIPKSARLVGHITQVQAHDSSHAFSQVAITFDRAELKNGQNFAIYTLIRGVRPNPSAMAMNSANSDDSFGAPMAGGGLADSGMGGARSGGGGVLGGAGRSVGGVGNGVGNAAGDPLGRATSTTSTLGDPAGVSAGVGAVTDTKVQSVGHGDMGLDAGAHNVAAARTVPHPTGIPGVMLAGSSAASGVFSTPKGDVKFEAGTQMQLGIVADR